ncbi:hypothetical protein H4R19_001530, partial [Coemansia spiralis]
RCLSMPRLPPTTLAAGLCDSLLEPLPPPPPPAGSAAAYVSPARSSGSRARYSNAASRSSSSSSSGYRRSWGVRKSVSPRPISVALASAVGGTSKRLSLQTAAAMRRTAQRCSGDRSGLTSPSAKLDTVHEADGILLPAGPAGSTSPASDMSAGMAYASATSALPPPSSMQQTFHTTRSGHRVSGPPLPPRVLRAAPSSCAFRSMGAAPSSMAVVGSGMLSSQNVPYGRGAGLAQSPLYRDGPTPAGSEADGESTAIHSQRSTARLSLPIEVKRRALATYVLELGITLYSVLVGLALAMSDRGFLALFIATCFHQFFEGLALGASLAELYWIEAQLAAHARLAAAELATDPPTLTESPEHLRIHHTVDVDNPRSVSVCYPAHGHSASMCDSNAADVAPSSLVDSHDFVHVSLHPQGYQQQQHQQNDRRSKSRRTLASMATSFVPEPWLVNPQLEKNLGTGDPAGPSTMQPPNTARGPAKRAQLPRYLLPRTAPERLPGWWKAWVSALAFTMTTPTGIIIGLALRNVYEPHSRYALLLNGVLQSICTGILVYVGLVSLILAGFASPQVRQMRRLLQVLLFVAVYAGAAAMASVKIWI